MMPIKDLLPVICNGLQYPINLTWSNWTVRAS